MWSLFTILRLILVRSKESPTGTGTSESVTRNTVPLRENTRNHLKINFVHLFSFPFFSPTFSDFSNTREPRLAVKSLWRCTSAPYHNHCINQIQRSRHRRTVCLSEVAEKLTLLDTG